MASPQECELEGTVIRVITPPLFLATKFVAFEQRGGGDYLSHDVEDIIAVVNGRPEVMGDVAAAAPDVREFLRRQFSSLLECEDFLNVLPGLVEQGRDDVIRGRLESMARAD